jgi:predicted RNase H-like nuclease
MKFIGIDLGWTSGFSGLCCLNSLVCAYIGAYWWHWGKERNWVLGDLSTSYLVIPSPARTSLASESLPN